MDFDDVIQKRRSIRKYKNKDISKEQIDYLLKAARTAPSRTNVQPWRFIVIRDQKVKEELAIASYNQATVAKAPVVVAVYGDIKAWKTVSNRTSELVSKGCFGQDVKEAADKVLVGWPQSRLAITTSKNATIAATILMLAAVNCGLSTCWIKLIKDAEIDRILQVPPNYICVGLFPIGYPDQDPKPRPRLPLETQVFSDIYGNPYPI